MLSSLLGAQMRVFDSNPSGRMLNRFSKDLGAVDETMPGAIAQSVFNLLLIFGILCLVSIINPAMLVVLAGSLMVVVLLLKLYLRAAQDLKRMEGISMKNSLYFGPPISKTVTISYISSQSCIFSHVSQS